MHPVTHVLTTRMVYVCISYRILIEVNRLINDTGVLCIAVIWYSYWEPFMKCHISMIT